MPSTVEEQRLVAGVGRAELGDQGLTATDREQPGQAGMQVAVEEPVTTSDRLQDASGKVEPVRPAVGTAHQPGTTTGNGKVPPEAIPPDSRPRRRRSAAQLPCRDLPA